MRVALISDIHSNLVALRAVLADIRRSGADQVVCLGDVATLGPQPEGVIETLGELGCLCIMGNHDEFLLDPQLVHGYSEATAGVIASVDWSRSRLSAADLEFIRGFAHEGEILLGDGATLRLFHGSPRSTTGYIVAATPVEALDEMLGGVSATVLAGGHSHMQMLRQHHGDLLVNPGSVGLPFRDYIDGTPTIMGHAEYAVVEHVGGAVTVSLRRIPLDRDALRRAQRETDHPMSAFLLRQYS